MGDPVGSCISQASFKCHDTVIIEIYYISIVTYHGNYINLGILVLLIVDYVFMGYFLL